ncbi:MAG: DNA polymerase III subunit gamma/tau [Acidimicrobiales bacterium]
MADQPFQALYRRHRPRRFAEVRGQDHVTTALRNAVASERAGHAYLFSGPRGTGKTSTARILAAALNCAAPIDGEPDCTCDSCVAVQTGASLDVLELDAASNNGVDAMRDLVARAALGSPGRWKVYIVDEVHMLTPGASAALLKTLEEPPAHVVFVLATTDDQKVLPTIKSRTQHYHFRLLAPEVLSGLVAELNEQDDLGLDPTTLDRVVRQGNGSARDALSALDQAAAAGAAEDEGDAVPQIVEALIAHDAGAALMAVAEAARSGTDPHRLGVAVVEHLRAGFLLVMAPDVAGVPERQRAAIEDHARRLGTPATVRAMEVLGETLVAMRESLDARVTLELALVRLASPAADASPAALLERLEALERKLSADGPPQESARPRRAADPMATSAPPAPVARPTTPPPRDEAPPPPLPPKVPAAGPKPTIGAVRQRAAQPPSPEEAMTRPAAPVMTLDRDELTKVWGDQIFGGLSSRARAAFRDGRWRAVEGGTATFLLGGATPRAAAEDRLAEVEGSLAAHLGSPLRVHLEIEGQADDEVPVSAAEFAQLETAPDAPASAAARLLEAFPGTEEVEP